jgi:hypothetical protein
MYMIRARHVKTFTGSEFFRFAATAEKAEQIKALLMRCASVQKAEIVPLGSDDISSLLNAAREREAAYAREKAE